jgi:hypothetical protein
MPGKVIWIFVKGKCSVEADGCRDSSPFRSAFSPPVLISPPSLALRNAIARAESSGSPFAAKSKQSGRRPPSRSHPPAYTRSPRDLHPGRPSRDRRPVCVPRSLLPIVFPSRRRGTPAHVRGFLPLASSHFINCSPPNWGNGLCFNRVSRIQENFITSP